MSPNTNPDQKSSTHGLKVLIAGAGIGGLAAAIALRQQGHHVELFERSRFANEIGAAIHLTPNANGLLKKIGVDARENGAVLTERIRGFNANGELEAENSITQDTWQHEWLLIHRGHLHEVLKEKAQAPGKGKPAILHISSKVTDIDPESATIVLEDGTAVQGDLIIGADGVHSAIRRYVQGGGVKPFSSGKNAFRFLVSRKEILDDPETADLLRASGSLDSWENANSRIIVYPCAHNQILNFVCIHSNSLSNNEAIDGWQQSVGKGTLLSIYQDFSPRIRKVLDKADPETLKIWPLLDLDTLPSWVNERFALIGDAAHPFLPYRASGGAMAIEDGLSLAAMLPGDVNQEDISERLKLYEKARHERVTTIQEFTRESGRRHLSVAEASKFISYIYDHDEWDNSTQLLREHLWSQHRGLYFRQPTVFGPMPGPRQDFWGRSRAAASTKATFCTASIKIKTSRTLLKNLLPNPSYGFSGTGSVAYATFSQTSLTNLDWLAGGGYNHLGLYIHGIEYSQLNGEVMKGSYLPVLFEDFADPIISGREEIGFPKVFSSIDVNKRQESHYVSTSWRGAVWGRMSLTGLKEVKHDHEQSTTASPTNEGLLVHRYMPRVGNDQKGTPEAEYPVFVNFGQEPVTVPSRINRVLKAEHADLHVDGLDWGQLPTLHHIISRLAEIPVYEVVEAGVVEGEGVPDLSSARSVSFSCNGEGARRD